MFVSTYDFAKSHGIISVISVGHYLISKLKGAKFMSQFFEPSNHNWQNLMKWIWVFPKIVGFPPKSSILIGFSIINHPVWGYLYFWKQPFLFQNRHLLLGCLVWTYDATIWKEVPLIFSGGFLALKFLDRRLPPDTSVDSLWHMDIASMWRKVPFWKIREPPA